MRIHSRTFIIIGLLVACFSPIDTEAVNITSSRPRVLLDQTLLASLQQQIHNNSQEWQELKQWCDNYLHSNSGYYLISGYRGQQWHKAIMNYGLCYQASGNDVYGREGVIYLEAMIDDYKNVGDGQGGDRRFAIDDGNGNAFVSRFVGAGATIGRDWLSGASTLDSQLINRVGQRVSYWLNYVQTSNNVYAFHDPHDNFWAGHFSFMYTAAISLSGDSNYDPFWFDYAYGTMWKQEVLPTLNDFHKGGDWQEGWSYGPFASRNIFLFLQAVDLATDLNILAESSWNVEIIKSHIHMLYPSRGYTSDDGSWSGNGKGDPRSSTVLAAASIANTSSLDRGLAKWRANNLTFELNPPDQWEAFLWKISDTEVTPTKASMGGLAYKTGSGKVFSRSDEWANTKATFVEFKGAATGATAQGERNTGEFKIASRGELLVVDGDTYQSESTYANVLLINGSHTYAPMQEWWRDSVNIDRYHVSSDHVYVRVNNLSNAYDGKHSDYPSLARYSRELIHLYPDYIIVRDYLEPSNISVNTIEASQINFPVNPTISGQSLTVSNGNAKLFMAILGHTGSMDVTDKSIPVRGNVFHVKFKPSTTASIYDIFHVFEAADSSKSSMDSLTHITGSNCSGVTIGTQSAIFAHSSDISYAVSTSGTQTIVGLDISTVYQVDATGTNPMSTILQSSSEGVITLALSAQGNTNISFSSRAPAQGEAPVILDMKH